ASGAEKRKKKKTDEEKRSQDKEIQTSVGFVYLVLTSVFNLTLDSDCEQSWYTEDGVVIADPSAHRWIEPVTSVSSDGLITSHCVDEVHHEIICHSTGLTHKTRYRAWNETHGTQNPEDLKEMTSSVSDVLLWIFAPCFIIVVLLVCFIILKGLICRCAGVRRDRDAEAAETESTPEECEDMDTS
ncbi:hypothetical protein IRJ41_023782, partial [Triplophysa rosa]